MKVERRKPGPRGGGGGWTKAKRLWSCCNVTYSIKERETQEELMKLCTGPSMCLASGHTLFWVLALLPFITKDTIFPAYSGETRQGSRSCFCLEALRWHDRTLCTRLPGSENVWPHRYLGGNETHNVENSQHPTKVFKNYCLATQLCTVDTFEWALRKDLLITGTRHGLMLNPAHFLFSWD